MASVSSILACMSVTLCLSFVTGELGTTTLTGLANAVKAYDAACWYETLQPGGKVCAGGPLNTYGGALGKPSDQESINSFKSLMKTKDMSLLPEEYGTKCNKFLEDPNMKPEQYESGPMGDSGKTYPFQGFAHCVIGTLRGRNGQKAIDIVTEDVLKANLDWRQSLLHRENFWRNRHGVAPLVLDDELSKSAQDFVTTMSQKDCYSLRESFRSERQYRNETTGENYSNGYFRLDSPIAGVLKASNQWYNQVTKYPFPGTCEGTPGCRIENVGGFTQTVWKDSQRVGYGYTYTHNCGYQVESRYYPAGNAPDEQAANVFPAKS